MQPLLIDLSIAALALLVFVADLLMPSEEKRGLGHLASAGLVLILLLTFVLDMQGDAFGGAYVLDPLALWFKRVFLLAGALAALIALDPAEQAFARRQGEYYLLLLLSLLGMSILSSARELLLIVVSFELMSLPLYVLTAFTKSSKLSGEGALKFYLVGATSLAITLFGLSLVFGATGTTMLPEIAANAGAIRSPLLVLGVLTTLAGLAFKIGAVPFHMWVPDTYEGAATPFVGFLAVAPKAAGFALLVRLYLVAFAPLSVRFQPALLALCVLTLVVGNVLALTQTNIKRLLAYSGIAQIGYMMVGLLAQTGEGVGMLLFYLAAYLFTNVGAFAVVCAVGAASGSDDIRAYRGLSRRNPALALAMLVFLLSLGGIPFVAGFWAKMGIFIAAWHAGLHWLVLLGAGLAVVGVYYYLRIARSLYLDDPEEGAQPITIGAPLRLALIVCGTAVVLIGIWPRPWFDTALDAAKSFLH
ncbi:MAG: NADH-quinone oxidoreductase subunit N [Planctomycetes bacterium]|nr:NADH-quinone oxidoreductase subunit N [Planctomycetota bacterium]